MNEQDHNDGSGQIFLDFSGYFWISAAHSDSRSMAAGIMISAAFILEVFLIYFIDNVKNIDITI